MSRISRRQVLAAGAAAGVTSALPSRSLWAANANEEISVGYISCGGRANQLMSYFGGVPGLNVTAVCDPDDKLVGRAKGRFPKAKGYSDLRKLLEQKDLDAVVVSTCNHWHCLAAIWAMEAGKDVYVEKPLSHSQWEGKQTVAAARRYDRICQIGTQQRSDPMQAEIKKFLHEDKVLGEIKVARVNRYGVRPSIGKRDTPLPIEKNVDYDLWLGPAQDLPIYRNKLHYDWHWDWNTGSGEMGNWGVHVLDDVRNNVFQDSVALPQKIFAGGGRVALNDAGQTPNIHFAYFDTGSIPVVIGLTNLPEKPGAKKSPSHPGPSSGYIVYCEGGRLEGQRGKAKAFDKNGKEIKSFSGNRGDTLHQKNFIDCVRSRKRGDLNAEVAVGNDSTGWCNLANVGVRAGGPMDTEATGQIKLDEWTKLVQAMEHHVGAHGLKLDDESIKLSKVLTLDPKTEQFVGEGADNANKFLKREYRKGYEVPELA